MLNGSRAYLDTRPTRKRTGPRRCSARRQSSCLWQRCTPCSWACSNKRHQPNLQGLTVEVSRSRNESKTIRRFADFEFPRHPNEGPGSCLEQPLIMLGLFQGAAAPEPGPLMKAADLETSDAGYLQEFLVRADLAFSESASYDRLVSTSCDSQAYTRFKLRGKQVRTSTLICFRDSTSATLRAYLLTGLD